MDKRNNKDRGEYLDFLKATSDKSKETLRHINEVLTSYVDFLKNKEFDKVKEKDVIGFLNKYSETTYNPRLSILRNFYRWKLGFSDRELPDFLKRLKLKSPSKIRNRRKMEYREKLVSEEEYQTLIDYCTKYQHKAIIETLKFFGIRNSELRSMRIKGVSYEDGLTKIVVYDSKTVPRDVVIDGRAEHLLTWINNYHPDKNNKENYVFTSNGNRQFTKTGIDEVLKRTCQKAGLRKILPHDFRHTSITNDRKNGIPDTHIETNHGLIQGSKMLEVYDHNEIKEYEEWLKKKQKEVKPKYELLEKQKKTLEEKHEKEIKELKKAFENLLYCFNQNQELLLKLKEEGKI